MAADGFIFEDRLAIMTTGNISGKRTQTDPLIRCSLCALLLCFLE